MAQTNLQLTKEEFQALLSQLDMLVQQFEALPYPQIQAKVFDLIQTIDAVHRAGLERLVDFLRAEGQAGLVERAAEDPIIQTLLVLYDLAPADALQMELEPAPDPVQLRPAPDGRLLPGRAHGTRRRPCWRSSAA